MLWRNRDYRLLISGQTIGVIGTQITTFALFLVVLNITDSPTLASTQSGLFVLSMVVFGLPIGRMVDRYPRLFILKSSAIIGLGGALLCVWAASGNFPIIAFAVATILLGAASSAFNTAERAFLKEIVDPDLLAQAMAVNQGRYSIGVIVGPPLAGVLISHSNQAPFLVDAASFYGF
ncbi:MFS transporter [Corynebacterium kutscheri]|uniref:Enterobactin exporter EntS n=2 Tax=Corynebacterium kutscheri TaxID=35755 RepID=A0AB38VSU4_9CORY|nr:MFS transporter [Corynebacterium kutscheri]VEH04964.1 enterobactin exporter EntS [Corynebacterium kutscheri]